MTPNPLVRGEAQRQATRPRPVVRGTFSLARAWRLAVGPASTRTLGLATTTVQHASRVSACRRELNSHNTAKPPRQSLAAWMRTSRPEGKAQPHPQFQASFWSGLNLQLQRRGATAPHRAVQLRGSIGLQSVRRAAAASIGAITLPVRCGGSKTLLPSIRCGPAGATVSGCPSTGARTVQRGLTLRSRRGPTALRLARAAPGVHDAPRGQGAMPFVPPQLKR